MICRQRCCGNAHLACPNADDCTCVMQISHACIPACSHAPVWHACDDAASIPTPQQAWCSGSPPPLGCGTRYLSTSRPWASTPGHPSRTSPCMYVHDWAAVVGFGLSKLPILNSKYLVGGYVASALGAPTGAAVKYLSMHLGAHWCLIFITAAGWFVLCTVWGLVLQPSQSR